MAHELRGAAAVVGVGLSRFGEIPGHNHMEIMAEAVHNAMEEAGVTRDQIDGIFGSNFLDIFTPLTVAEYFGFKPRFMDGTNIGGSSFVNAIQSAAAALKLGLCEVALIAYGSNVRTMTRRGRPGGMINAESVYKPRLPITAYALAASRHMYEFGTTRKQMAEVAVAARAWARKNPAAFIRDPLTIHEVLNARMVVDPFGVRDCCLITDGGAAMIMTAADKVNDYPTTPVYVLGVGSATTHNMISQMQDLTTTAVAQSAPIAFNMAGISTRDVDIVELYDAFTINTILFLEDMGFCAKGEGGEFVSGGNIAPGGSLPVNTNGGGLSCVHPGMYGLFLMIEAVQQLRGEAEERQVDGAEIAVCNGNGGMLSSQVTAVFGTEATL